MAAQPHTLPPTIGCDDAKPQRPDKKEESKQSRTQHRRPNASANFGACHTQAASETKDQTSNIRAGLTCSRAGVSSWSRLAIQSGVLRSRSDKCPAIPASISIRCRYSCRTKDQNFQNPSTDPDSVRGVFTPAGIDDSHGLVVGILHGACSESSLNAQTSAQREPNTPKPPRKPTQWQTETAPEPRPTCTAAKGHWHRRMSGDLRARQADSMG